MASVANVEETALYLPQEFVTESVGFSFDIGKNLFPFNLPYRINKSLTISKSLKSVLPRTIETCCLQ